MATKKETLVKTINPTEVANLCQQILEPFRALIHLFTADGESRQTGRTRALVALGLIDQVDSNTPENSDFDFVAAETRKRFTSQPLCYGSFETGERLYALQKSIDARLQQIDYREKSIDARLQQIDNRVFDILTLLNETPVGSIEGNLKTIGERLHKLLAVQTSVPSDIKSLGVLDPTPGVVAPVPEGLVEGAETSDEGSSSTDTSDTSES
jgi:hypothetical protein